MAKRVSKKIKASSKSTSARTKKTAPRTAAARAALPARKAASKGKAPSRNVAKGARSASGPKAPARKAAGRSASPGSASHVPEGIRTVTPNLVFRDASPAIAFYKEAFGAVELRRMMSPDGKNIWHAEIRIGDSVIFVNDESPMSTLRAPSPQHAPTASIQLYVPDCDAVVGRAMNHGAIVTMPPADMFWGDRMGMLTDPFGQVWAVATKVKPLSDEEMRRAGEAFVKQMAAQATQAQQQPAQVPPATPTQPRAEA